MRQHPETVNARYLAPPAALVAVAAGTALGTLGLATGSRLLELGFLAPAGYVAGILAGSAVTGRALPPRPWSGSRWSTRRCTVAGLWASSPVRARWRRGVKVGPANAARLH